MSHQNKLYQLRTNMNFAMKHNVQTYLNNDEYNYIYIYTYTYILSLKLFKRNKKKILKNKSKD